MTDIVNFSNGHTPNPRENAASFEAVGMSDAGWVLSGASIIAQYRDDITGTELNAFAHVGTTGHDVTFDTGEAVVYGAPLARDTQSTVTLASGVANQLVYVGWEPGAESSITVGLSSAFTTDAQRIPLYEFDTDSTTVTATRDERVLTKRLNRQNQRYEGDGTPVDLASDANALGGQSPSAWLRATADDTMEAVLGHRVGTSYQGTLGAGDGEFERWAGGSSDLTLSLQGGHGRVVWAWNAYYDSAGGVWRSVRADEEHAAVTVMANPGGGTASANLGFATAPSNAAAGDAITWNVTVMQEDGSWQFNGGELQGAVIENRTTRPTSPEPGRLIYRTDKDA